MSSAPNRSALRRWAALPLRFIVGYGFIVHASIYFHDPDGHLLEYVAMLTEDPRPDGGVVRWHEWHGRVRSSKFGSD